MSRTPSKFWTDALRRVPQCGQSKKFLYVAELCDGRVKVGLSGNPRYRLLKLSQRLSPIRLVRIDYAEIRAKASGRWWSDAELNLIRRAQRIGCPHKTSREYFTGIRFEEAADLMRKCADNRRASA